MCFYLAVDLFDHPSKFKIQNQPITLAIKAIKLVIIFIMDISINEMNFILLLVQLLNFKKEHRLFLQDHQDHQFVQ